LRFLPILLTVACAPRATLSPKYYAAELQFARSQTAQELNGVQILNERVHAALKSPSLTLAFYPPDACLEAKASPTGGSSRTLLSMQCGERMSQLETAAALNGYQVVSWQLLKDDNPLAISRDLHVDLLIEVNEFGSTQVSQAKESVTDIAFFEQVNVDRRREVSVPDVATVGDRCLARHGPTLNPEQAEAATLSAKMVSVADGRALWVYRRTRAGQDDELALVRRLWFEAPGEAQPSLTRRLGRTLIGLGAGVFVVSLPLMAVGHGEGDPGALNAAQTLAPVGVSAVVAGSAFDHVGWRLGQAGRWPEPQDVLCLSDPLTRNPFLPEPRPQGPAAPTSGSSYRVEEQLGGMSEEQDLSAALRSLIDDFFQELSKL
jgi:hypothetical protein